ncbi:nicotinate (nicotinamide) nucleotide adenylyltransferase [Psychrobacter jeotgali]|uniref:nicotinate (nicotinamide) nucleotide adenylyltransferase n=1 Tax=Psychrobacter jeotgali TaxID=179010 RepID=UPI00191AC90E|nr:nicotinate (nicotinamide) nucleotide adenylyltransferase [Psychrobacter jeotgali]
MTDTRTHANIKSAPAIRAYLGGSFNPVHNAHIQMAMQVYNQLLPLAEQQQCSLQVCLLPNARSPFKQKTIAPEHRLAMLKLAIQATPLQICELELWQQPPVYSIDTVRTLRLCYPNDSLIFIMGMDSARSLDKWKDGLQLTDYVHLWIFSRPHKDNQNPHIDSILAEKNIATLRDELPNALAAKVTENLSDLTLLPISAPLSDSVIQTNSPLKTSTQGHIYIDQHPIISVSSTEIRKQLSVSLSLNQSDTAEHHYQAKCLNPAVYQYIIEHELYSAAQFR